MKTLVNVCLVLFLAVIFMPNVDAQQDNMSDQEMEWEQAKSAYHKVMASTFHPAEEGDLEPLKTQHNVLAWQADNWAATSIPKELRTKELKANMKLLKSASKDLSRLVLKGGSDAELTKAMFALHDTFHTIVGLCHHM